MKKFKLPKATKKVWLQKLRDGSYKKCVGRIGTGNRRCALGILVAEGFTKPVFGCYLPSDFMPREIQKQIGMMSDMRKSFKTIADWVEKNLGVAIVKGRAPNEMDTISARADTRGNQGPNQEEKSLRAMISPKYEEWEILARAEVRAYIRYKMRMNFHQDVESAFVQGARWMRGRIKDD